MTYCLPPRSAYIHVPFCRHRCGYCNFTLVAGRDDLVERYLQAVELELSALGEPREVETLYFGGGTPTHLSPEQFRQLALAVLKWHPLAKEGGMPSLAPHVRHGGFAAANSREAAGPDRERGHEGASREHATRTLRPAQDGPGQDGSAQDGRAICGADVGYEWTVEANPADVDEAMIGVLAELGVTRLSLGGQSFRDAKLELLERDHRAADIERAVRLARQAGISVALDLIFATPGETLDQWQADLQAAVELEPDHVSTYGLTFEKGTSFWSRLEHGELNELDDGLQREMYAAAIDRLAAAGLEHYEISNFARPGRRSRHNQVYWSGAGYWAAGPGAARYVDGVRETNHRSVTTYLDRVLAGRSPVDVRERLDDQARARELLIFALRRIEGIARDEFRMRTGYQIDELVGKPLAKFVGLGLLADDGERVRLTREGLFVSDALWPEMV